MTNDEMHEWLNAAVAMALREVADALADAPLRPDDAIAIMRSKADALYPLTPKDSTHVP